MRDLPFNWAEATLGQLSTEPEQVVPTHGETIRYIDIGSIDRVKKQIVRPQTLRGEDAPSRARKRVSTGDTLVSMTRPNLNAVALVPAELNGEIASTGFDVLRPREGIDPRWLAYVVRTDEFIAAMSSLVQGALYPAVRSRDVRSFVAPIAPTSEQAHIADRLATLVARVQACSTHLDAIPQLIHRLRTAAITSGITGELFEINSGNADSSLIERSFQIIPIVEVLSEQGDCMKETTKDVVLVEASKREISTPNAPRNARRELVGVLCRCAGSTHASLPVSVG